MKTTKTMKTAKRLRPITGLAVAMIAAAAAESGAAMAAGVPVGSGGSSHSMFGRQFLMASADAPVLPVSTVTPEAPEPPQKMLIPQPVETIPAPATVVPDRGSSVSLDFIEASIVDVLKALSLQAGYNIVASPDVTGKTTVSLSHVSLESALDYVSKTAGYKWLRRDNTYLVGTDKSLEPFQAPKIVSTERITRTVEFQNSDSDDLIASVKAAIPDVSVTLIKPASETTTTAGAGGATSVTVREKGGILMVTGLAQSVKNVQDFVQLAEATFHPSVEESETTVYRIRYMFAPNLITILKNLVPKLTVITGPAQQFESGEKIKFTSNSANGSFSLSDRYSVDSGLEAGVKDTGPTDKIGKNLAPPTQLVLTGSKEDISRALDLLSKVDVKPAQIMFEAKVTEISDTYEKDLGVNWDLSGAIASMAGLGSGTAFTFGTISGAATTVLKSPSTMFGATTTTPSTILQASLKALVTQGRAKVVASPNIAALDGQRATVFVGQTINYVQSITTSTTGQNVTTASVPVGVLLSLSGRASDDGFITVYLHPEVDAVTSWMSVTGGGQLPQLSTRFADTIIRVKSGDTIAIGGLTEDDITVDDSKVPILGDLPILKNVFNSRTKKTTKQNVIFFIRTSLVEDHT